MLHQPGDGERGGDDKKPDRIASRHARHTSDVHGPVDLVDLEEVHAALLVGELKGQVFGFLGADRAARFRRVGLGYVRQCRCMSYLPFRPSGLLNPTEPRGASARPIMLDNL